MNICKRDQMCRIFPETRHDSALSLYTLIYENVFYASNVPYLSGDKGKMVRYLDTALSL